MTPIKRAREGFMLLEAVIALAIALIALGMLYMAPGWMYKTANYTEIEAALFDVGFSYAEQVLMGSGEVSDNMTVSFKTSSSSGVGNDRDIKFQCSYSCESSPVSDDLPGIEYEVLVFTIEPIGLSYPLPTLTFTGIGIKNTEEP